VQAGDEGRRDDDEVEDVPAVPEEVERSTSALRDCARFEGILLGPVYTSKAVAGLRQWIEGGRLTEAVRVLFVHTGGAPALFAYHEVYG